MVKHFRHIDEVSMFHSCHQVQIYSGEDSQLLGTVSRFKDVAYSGSYRRDGKLLVAGTEDKLIKLFNPGTRSLLRTFEGHTG